MTTREALHQPVDELPEDRAELAHAWLQDLRDAADEDGPPLDPEALASLDRGLADLASGRVKPCDHGQAVSPARSVRESAGRQKGFAKCHDD
jgi:hypothetical protein